MGRSGRCPGRDFGAAKGASSVCETAFFPCAAGYSGRWESGNPGFGFPVFHGPQLILRFGLPRLRLGIGVFGLAPRLEAFERKVSLAPQIQARGFRRALFRAAAMPARLLRDSIA